MTRVLVCGGRGYNNSSLIYKTLDEIHSKTPISVIIEGGAKGADLYARLWCHANLGSSHLVTYKADWKTYGKPAGPIRNLKMITEGKPDLVVAFPGGKGTANMIKLAEEYDVETLVVT